jgi:hypothetical protein
VQNGGRFRLGSAICIVGVFPFGHRAPLAARIFHSLIFVTCCSIFLLLRSPGPFRFRARKCRNQSRLNDSGIFNRHIADVLDLRRLAGIRVGVHREAGITQPRHADRNLVLVAKDVSISIRQRFVGPKNRNVGGNRMFFGTPPSESNRLPKSVRRNLLGGRHIPAPLRFMAANQQQA